MNRHQLESRIIRYLDIQVGKLIFELCVVLRHVTNYHKSQTAIAQRHKRITPFLLSFDEPFAQGFKEKPKLLLKLLQLIRNS